MAINYFHTMVRMEYNAEQRVGICIHRIFMILSIIEAAWA